MAGLVRVVPGEAVFVERVDFAREKVDFGGLELLEILVPLAHLSKPAIVLLADPLLLLQVIIVRPQEGVIQDLGPRHALVGLLDQQSLQKGLELGAHVAGVLDRIPHDHFDQRVQVVRIKRRLTREQLVQNDAIRPNVDAVVVRLLLDQLRRHVQRGALGLAEQPVYLDRGEHNRVRAHRAREAEVAELDDAVVADEDVLGLHIPVDNAVFVQVEQRVSQLSGDLLDLAFAHLVVFFEDLEEFALRVFGDQTKVVFGFEPVQKQDDIFVA